VSFQVNSVSDLRVGDIGFTTIAGVQGAAVLGGQSAIDMAALLRGRRAETAGVLTHAFLCVDGGYIEAMPGGARFVMGEERVGPGWAYTRLPDDVGRDGAFRRAAYEAGQMLGTPYGWAQYAAIAALTLRGGVTASPKGLLARYVARSPAMICSQLVDEAYRRAGVHLFADGRPPGYVTPGALFWRTAELGDVCICT
jgi:hypothetical protein